MYMLRWTSVRKLTKKEFLDKKMPVGFVKKKFLWKTLTSSVQPAKKKAWLGKSLKHVCLTA